MTAQEFVQYMTPKQLIGVIDNNWLRYHDTPPDYAEVTKICYAEIVQSVGVDDAVEMVKAELGDSATKFLEVAS